MGTAEPVALLEHIQSILSSLEFSRSWNMPPLPWSRRTGECGILVANLPCCTTGNLASPLTEPWCHQRVHFLVALPGVSLEGFHLLPFCFLRTLRMPTATFLSNWCFLLSLGLPYHSGTCAQ